MSLGANIKPGGIYSYKLSSTFSEGLAQEGFVSIKGIGVLSYSSSTSVHSPLIPSFSAWSGFQIGRQIFSRDRILSLSLPLNLTPWKRKEKLSYLSFFYHQSKNLTKILTVAALSFPSSSSNSYDFHYS